MIVFITFFILSQSRYAGAQDECQPTSCDLSGPIIRFPFRLFGAQPDHCGFPGFILSCNSTNNNTEFNFQYPVRASFRNIILPISAQATVQEIDYRNQLIRVRILNGSCLPNRVPLVSATASPFEIPYQSSGDTLFNCSGSHGFNTQRASGEVNCLNNDGFKIYAYQSSYSVSDISVSNCAKMYNISYVSNVILTGLNEYSYDDTRLHWPEPDCSGCEARGMYCRLRVNGSTECVDVPRQPEQNNRGVSRSVIILVVVIGVFLMALVFAGLYHVYRSKRNKKRIRQFLEDYKDLRPSRYTYAEVKKITDGFKHKLGQGGFGTVFKGKLSNDIFVAVKVLNHTQGNSGDFINEIGTIGKIHHVNVVRLVGYCADGNNRALVYEFLENDSLQKYISPKNHARSLSWEKMHEVALGIAKGLDYLHQGCHQRILHFDIKPHNILLDQNLNPKVADFGLAKLCSKEKSVVTMTAARGTIGYIAPEVFSRNFGKVSYKSDIYSFGMLLLDMVGGRKGFHAEQQVDSQIYFPEWMYNQLDKGGDLGVIHIENKDGSDIVKRLIIVGLWCIQWYPADRPSTKVVIKMLEGENLPIMPPNPFAASEYVNTNTTSSEISMSSSEICSDP